MLRLRRALLDEEDLFCAELRDRGASTGGTAPTAGGAAGSGQSASAAASSPPVAHEVTCNFVCHGCGASMSYDASAGALRCPFCGSTELVKQPDAKEIAPEGVVPFAIPREQAVAAHAQMAWQQHLAAGRFVGASAVVSMTPVYVPFWVFEAQTHTYF